MLIYLAPQWPFLFSEFEMKDSEGIKYTREHTTPCFDK